MANQPGHLKQAGERLQGQAAYESAKRSGLGALLLKIAGGLRLPTRQAHINLVLRGEKWDKQQDELAGAITARKKELYAKAVGIEAAKLTMIEAAGGSDERTARLAVAELIKMNVNTRSWAESQDVAISQGNPRGRRVTELPVWQEAIAQDPELYQLVLANRPDRLPDIIQAAEQKAGFRYADPGADLDLLSKLCIEEALNSHFKVDSISKLDRGFFAEIARLGDPSLSRLLYNHLRQIKGIGDVGKNAVGRLSGPTGSAIDAALAPIGQSYTSL